jgi:glycosyltransferase involved in cell wall biosynthesis
MVYCAVRRLAFKLHRQRAFDIIYARFFAPDGYAAWRLSKELGIPAVAVGAGDDVNVDPGLNHIIRSDFTKVANELDGVLASGAKAAASIKAVSCREVQAVHGVVDLDEFSPVEDRAHAKSRLGLDPNRFTALYVGTYKKAKGVYELIDAVERVSKSVPEFVLNICGYGREEESMRHMIAQKHLEEVIRMVGLVDPGDMPRWMQAADMLILPSYEEGMPNAVMEAMACGLPIVASAVGGLPNEVGDCDGAVLIPPKSVDELVAAIMRIVHDRDLRTRMQAASRRRAEEKFSVGQNAAFVLSYLQQVVDRRKNVQTTLDN